MKRFTLRHLFVSAGVGIVCVVILSISFFAKEPSVLSASSQPVFSFGNFTVSMSHCDSSDLRVGKSTDMSDELETAFIKAGIRTKPDPFEIQKMTDLVKKMRREKISFPDGKSADNIDIDSYEHSDYEIAGKFEVICCTGQKGKYTVVFRGTVTDLTNNTVVAYPVAQQCCRPWSEGERIVGKKPTLWQRLFGGYIVQVEGKHLLEAVQTDAVKIVVQEAKRIQVSHAKAPLAKAEIQIPVCPFETSKKQDRGATKKTEPSTRQNCNTYCAGISMGVAHGRLESKYKEQFETPAICPFLKTYAGQSFSMDVIYDSATRCACRMVSPVTSNFVPPNEGCWQVESPATYLDGHWTRVYASFVCKTANPKVTLQECQ